MSHLDHIIEKVASGQRHTEEWYLLRNAFFRGNDPINDVKRWANENSMDARRHANVSPHIVDQ